MLLSCFLIRTSVPSPTYSCCRRWNYYTFHFCFCACIIRTPTYSCCRRWNYYQFYYCCSEFAEFCKTIILPIANSLFSIVSQKENSKKKGRLEGGVVGQLGDESHVGDKRNCKAGQGGTLRARRRPGFNFTSSRSFNNLPPKSSSPQNLQ